VERFDLFVVGGGAAGMAAALAAEEAGARVLLAEQEEALGGILNQCIHSGFGLGFFGENLTGPEYAQRFRTRLEHSSVTVWTGMTVLSLEKDRTALLSGRQGLKQVKFERCILAAGCREKPLGSLPVTGTRPAGIFTAGQAQKLVNLGRYEIGQDIVILGSGDIGQIMARRFVLEGRRVVAMVEEKETLGGMLRNQRECVQAHGIPVILRATVDEVLGQGRVSGVMVHHLESGKRERLSCDTLVTAIGLLPERTLVESVEEDGVLPGWLHLCGNCEYVHEIVDSVTARALTLGKKLFS